MKTLAGVLYNLLVFMIVAMPMVVLHELGHLWAFRAIDIEVREFSIGVGPLLYQHTSEEGLLISLRAIPFLSYVTPSLEGIAQIKYISTSQRVFIYGAGVFFHFTLCAAIIYYHLVRGWRKRYINNTSLMLSIAKTPYYIVMQAIAAFVDLMSFGKTQWQKSFLIPTGGVLMDNTARFICGVSMILFVINTMPVPPLDGNKMLVAAVEGLDLKHLVFEIPNFLIGGFLGMLFASNVLGNLFHIYDPHKAH